MSNLAENFDFGANLNEIDDTQEFTPLPAGDYLVAATKIELADTKAGNGKMVKTTFTVTEGQNSGRLIFENYNIQNPNSEAVRIALQSIKAWCLACGVTGNERLTMGLINDLENREFRATVKIAPAKNGYDAQNRIKKYTAAGGTSALVPVQNTPDVAPVDDRAGKKPWER